MDHITTKNDKGVVEQPQSTELSQLYLENLRSSGIDPATQEGREVLKRYSRTLRSTPNRIPTTGDSDNGMALTAIEIAMIERVLKDV